MIDAQFAVILGASLLSFAFVPAAYLVWIRIVGLEPTIGQRYAGRSSVARSFLALGFGSCLGIGAELAPSISVGVSASVLFAATSFAALILFESYSQRAHRS